MNKADIDLSLMYVTDHQIKKDKDFFAILHEALKGGATIIQLREKHLTKAKLYKKAQQAKLLCDLAKVPLIINDHLDIALAIDCAGVHLGQSDLPIEVARKILGKAKMIGLSVSSLEEATKDNTRFADYLGVSPLFSTTTKTDDLARPLGLDGLAKIAQQSHLPLVSIGGIDESNADSAFRYGSTGIAVVSAISRSQHPKQSTQRLKQLCPTGSTK